MKRIACFAVTIATFAVALFVMAGSSAQAQTATTTTTPDQSLGDYARKVHKDPATKSKPKVVFDNDNMPKEDKLSVVGDASAAAEGAAADSSAKATDDKEASGTKAADDDPAKKQVEWKGWQDKLSAQKNAIDLSSRELDVLQKEYQLRAAAMYGDAGNRMRNAAAWDKEDADFKQKIADKQKAVEDAKQKLDDMQEDARKAGVPAAMREPQSSE
ncbi:MAG: hypothetical protein WAL52_10695 [Candidatus Sulfotelmatobacter sp.]